MLYIMSIKRSWCSRPYMVSIPFFRIYVSCFHAKTGLEREKKLTTRCVYNSFDCTFDAPSVKSSPRISPSACEVCRTCSLFAYGDGYDIELQYISFILHAGENTKITERRWMECTNALRYQLVEAKRNGVDDKTDRREKPERIEKVRRCREAFSKRFDGVYFKRAFERQAREPLARE